MRTHGDYTCLLCRAATAAPDVHAICGRYGREPECAPACPAARRARRRFVDDTDAAWAAATGNPAGWSGERGTHAELGARLGGARGTPDGLAGELARIFERTWGQWAVRAKAGWSGSR